MLYLVTIISVLEVLAVTIPVLLTVAYITIAERKTMASMQRRLGPNSVGWYGLLQAFADALKLLLKEYVSPTQANTILFFLGPIITLIFSLLGYAVIPYGTGLMILDYDLGILYILAMSSLATYGILLAGWSANSKYAFLGSLRSTAQLISYELILSSAILIIILVAGSLDITVIIEAQRAVWYIVPLFPVFIIFFIGSIAETNRAPFDLAEAESELVSGFMTEHSAVIFVFFFLAEYASIVLICILNSILFLGGYLYVFYNVLELIFFDDNYTIVYDINQYTNSYEVYGGFYNLLKENTLYSVILGIKACIAIFTFIWARASFPRIRFDQLMSYCWTILLPIVVAIIILLPCVIYITKIMPLNIALFSIALITKKPIDTFKISKLLHRIKDKLSFNLLSFLSKEYLYSISFILITFLVIIGEFSLYFCLTNFFLFTIPFLLVIKEYKTFYIKINTLVDIYFLVGSLFLLVSILYTCTISVSFLEEYINIMSIEKYMVNIEEYVNMNNSSTSGNTNSGGPSSGEGGPSSGGPSPGGGNDSIAAAAATSDNDSRREGLSISELLPIDAQRATTEPEGSTSAQTSTTSTETQTPTAAEICGRSYAGGPLESPEPKILLNPDTDVDLNFVQNKLSARYYDKLREWAREDTNPSGRTMDWGDFNYMYPNPSIPVKVRKQYYTRTNHELIRLYQQHREAYCGSNFTDSHPICTLRWLRFKNNRPNV